MQEILTGKASAAGDVIVKAHYTPRGRSKTLPNYTKLEQLLIDNWSLVSAIGSGPELLMWFTRDYDHIGSRVGNLVDDDLGFSMPGPFTGINKEG